MLAGRYGRKAIGMTEEEVLAHFREAGEAEVGVPLIPLLSIEAPIYAEDALPEALAAIPAEKPGSRALNPG